ncbi:MAG: 16S rRNA (guanine(527)-N(7))-methyltransferase RsmG [Oscillospiraceae bacterium]|nr:16S rRNA (guanine(527)-N(7))-methyltransferase RsmG [Oscillospiraceae bacterium]
MKMKPMFDFLKTELPPQVEEQFATYCDVLLETNKVMNLTAITDPEEVFVRHFYDSIAIMQFLSFENKSVIDVGCGAGFPGLPLKLANPSISLTLLDSLDKRIRFLSDLCERLQLSDVSCIHGRAEEVSRTDARESFDFAVSRAVAALPMLCELCLPFVKVGGALLALKAEDCEEELASAQNAIKTLGGELTEKIVYDFPNSDCLRSLLVIQKISETPEKYPRRFAKIQKSPL